MTPILLDDTKKRQLLNSKKINLPKQTGVIFNPKKPKDEKAKKVDQYVNARNEQRSVDADVTQKKVGSSENINPNLGFSPERY